MPPVGDPPTRASYRKLLLQWYAAHDRPMNERTIMPSPIPTKGYTPRVPLGREPRSTRRRYSS